MSQTIRVPKDAIAALEKETELAIQDRSRTLKDVTDKDVRRILDNPGCELEIYDALTGNVVKKISAGQGAATAFIGWGILIAAAAIIGFFLGNDDKKKSEEESNRKQKLFQEAIRKMKEELGQEKKKNRERREYLECLIETLEPR